MNRLITTEGGQYRVKTPLLLLFSTAFIVWQMGVLFYSGTTMSLFGRTPIPLTSEDTSLVIAAGYIASILFICLFPRKTVWAERILLPAALMATVLMLFPFPPRVVTALFYISAFVCCFSIGGMASLAAQHFTVETCWRDGILSMAAGGALIAALQNDVYNVSFTAFTVLSLLLLAGLTVFHWLIPAEITVPYVTRENPVRMPKILFFGLWSVSAFSTLLLCFASSFAESVRNGVSVLYLSAAFLGVALYLLKKRFDLRSVRLFGGFFMLSVLGFALSLLSLSVPALRLPVCILLGFVVALANLWIFFAAAAFAVYPTRFIGAIGAGVGLALAALHSGLLEALRTRPELLYAVYAALSVALLIIYYFMEPYFSYAWAERQRGSEPAAPSPYGSGAAADGLPAPARARSAPLQIDSLSEQERNLAALILAGHTESSVAREMNISLNTQKSYRKNLYAKLDIHSKRELFELAERCADKTAPAP